MFCAEACVTRSATHVQESLVSFAVGGQTVHTYVCCQCTNCGTELLLEYREDPKTNILNGVPRPRTGHETCPECRSIFVPVTYYVKECAGPLHTLHACGNRKT